MFDGWGVVARVVVVWRSIRAENVVKVRWKTLIMGVERAKKGVKDVVKIVEAC